MADLPTGTVTFLFTDIEGSTNLLQRIGAHRYAQVLEDHCALLRSVFHETNGHEIGHQGDGFLAAFGQARQAVSAAIAAQRAMATHPWPEGVTIRVRMGLHTGEPLDSPSGYVGMDVHRAARICSAAHGGQVLLSEATRGLVEHNLPEGLGTLDLGVHRLKDLKDPVRIFQILDPRVPAEFPPLRSLSVLPNNLPMQLTSFIGRDKELAAIKHLLMANRFLTLTGTGGCGKTRLALQAAADLSDQFPDGVWLVELAALSDTSLVPQTVASTLKLPEQSTRPLPELLADYLRPKSLLLVLDNCEQVVNACAHLAERLLQVCPRLRILATSQEGLNIAGEVTFPVPSLSVPDPQPALSAEGLVLWEAVRLFVDRAMFAQPMFRLTNQNATSIVEVCRRLDGMPLAIELAAARVRVLSVEQIAARLNDRFQLLVTGSRTALPRHQTLRATMDWSYDLLSEKERALLSRLSVFSGGWTLEAAEAVCVGNGVDERDVLDLLARLADRSLIVVEDRGAEIRYRQLETIRQYGHDRLRESGAAPSVRGRHRDWFLRLAERAEPELLGKHQARWFNLLEAELDNLRSALGWCVATGELEAELRLASAVTRFWLARGYSDEGRRWLDAGLERGRDAPAALRAKALSAAGYLAVQGQGDYSSGRSFFDESLAIWRTVGDKKGIAESLHRLGLVATHLGELSTAHSLYEESLVARQELGDKGDIALTLHNLGMVAFLRGDLAARSLFEQALAVWHEVGDKQHIAMALTGLGYIAASQDDLKKARSLYEESLAIRQELRDKWGIAYSLEGFATLAALQGLANRAARLLGAVEALREAIRTPLPLFYRNSRERTVAGLRAGLGEAAFAAACEKGRAMTLEQAMSEALKTENDEDD